MQEQSSEAILYNTIKADKISPQRQIFVYRPSLSSLNIYNSTFFLSLLLKELDTNIQVMMDRKKIIIEFIWWLIQKYNSDVTHIC